MALCVKRFTQLRGQAILFSAKRNLLSNSVKISEEDENSRKAAFVYQSCSILDSAMAFLDTKIPVNGREAISESNRSKIISRPTIIFLHGNPASSFLWRNILPAVASYSRCFAPDLMGMGRSGPIPSNSYRFVDQAVYLDEFFRKILTPHEKVVLVGHDWGSALAFHWAFRNEHRVHAIVHMESIISPMSYDEFPASAVGIFKALRSPIGEELIFQKNAYIEHFLPASVLRTLTKDEFHRYKEPFVVDGRSRKPMLDLVREIPIIDEGPNDVIGIVQDYRRWLCTSETPKLYLHASPGFYSPYILKRVRHWRNHHARKVTGLHFLQEDSPREIADAIVAFLKSISPHRR